MSDFEKCRRCHEYAWIPCSCTRHEIAQPDTGGQHKGQVHDDDWEEVYGRDAEDIVQAWAQRYDSDGDYTIVRGGEEEVWVRDGDGNVTRWKVTGESVPSYHATQIPADSAGEKQ